MGDIFDSLAPDAAAPPTDVFDQISPPAAPAAPQPRDIFDEIEPIVRLHREVPTDLGKVTISSKPIKIDKAMKPVMPDVTPEEVGSVRERVKKLTPPWNYERWQQQAAESDYGPPPMPGRESLLVDLTPDNIRKARLTELADNYLNLADAAPTFAGGFQKAFSGEGGANKLMPFVGGISSSIQKGLRNELITKMKAGKPLDDTEQAAVDAMTLAERRLKQPEKFWEKVSEITGESAPYALEFGMTGGVYSTVRGALGKVAGRALGVAAQTAVSSVPRISDEYLDRIAPNWHVNPDTLRATIDDHQADKNWLAELTKAGASQYIENLSERTGGILGKMIPKEGIAKILRLGAAKAWMDRMPGVKSVSDALNHARQAMAFHGVPEEIAEEYFGNGLKALVGVDDQNNVPEKIAQGDMPGAFAAFLSSLPVKDTPAMAASFGMIPAGQRAVELGVGGTGAAIDAIKRPGRENEAYNKAIEESANRAALEASVPMANGGRLTEIAPTDTRNLQIDDPRRFTIQPKRRSIRRGGRDIFDVIQPEEGGPDATQTIEQPTGVPGQRVGTDAVGQAQPEAGVGNRVPGATGQPTPEVVTEETPPVTPVTPSTVPKGQAAPPAAINTSPPEAPAKKTLTAGEVYQTPKSGLGRASENRDFGFAPAFRDTETGKVYPSTYADGSPARVHITDGLPDDVVAARDEHGAPSEFKPTLEAGFVREGKYFTRDQASELAAKLKAEPTDAQKKAGNYPKEHVKIHGLDISIENKAGSVRTGKDKGGKEWSVTMPADYGYIKRTEGKDGDQVDVYVGPQPESKFVLAIDQIDPATGKFDEHKMMLGFPDKESAVTAYLKAFSDNSGLKRIGVVTPMTVDSFKEWLKTSDTTKPVAYKQKQAAPPTSSIRKPGTKAPPSETKPPEQGKVGMMLGSGQVVLTSSGRQTTPFPEVKTDTDRKTTATLKRVEEWLRDNAIAEAKSRKDEFNGRMFEGEKVGNIPPASKDAMEEYLFGQQPKVIPSILKTVEAKAPDQLAELKAQLAAVREKLKGRVVDDRLVSLEKQLAAAVAELEKEEKPKLDLTVTGQAKPLPNHPDYNYTVHFNRKEVADQVGKYKVTITHSTKMAVPPIYGHGDTAESAYARAVDQLNETPILKQPAAPVEELPSIPQMQRELRAAGWIHSAKGDQWLPANSEKRYHSTAEAYAALKAGAAKPAAATTETKPTAPAPTFKVGDKIQFKDWSGKVITGTIDAIGKSKDGTPLLMTGEGETVRADDKSLTLLSEKPTAATDKNLAEMSDEDFDALLDEASKPEEKPAEKPAAKPEKLPNDEKLRRAGIKPSTVQISARLATDKEAKMGKLDWIADAGSNEGGFLAVDGTGKTEAEARAAAVDEFIRKTKERKAQKTPAAPKSSIRKPKAETPEPSSVKAIREELKKLRQGLPVAEDMAMNDKGASLDRLNAKIKEAQDRLDTALAAAALQSGRSGVLPEAKKPETSGGGYTLYEKDEPFAPNGKRYIVAGPEEYGIKGEAKAQGWKKVASDLTRDEAFAQQKERNAAFPNIKVWLVQKHGIRVNYANQVGPSMRQQYEEEKAKFEKAKSEAAPPTTPEAKPPTKAPTEHLSDAAKAIKEALDEAAKGLDELFGGGSHTGSGGPSFDEKTYAKAKPHFDKAWEHAKSGGGSILDFIKGIVDRWGNAIKPYLKRWREDVVKGATETTAVAKPERSDEERFRRKILGPPLDAPVDELIEALKERLVLAGDHGSESFHATGTWFDMGWNYPTPGEAYISARGVTIRSTTAEVIAARKSGANEVGTVSERPPTSGKKLIADTKDDIKDASEDPDTKAIRTIIFSDADGQNKGVAVRKLASETGRTVKEMQERIELELVRVADEIARDGTLTPFDKFNQLRRIYEKQPTMSARTSTSVGNQAYSTPLPLAFALGHMVGITPQTDVYEPTAGNGALMMGADFEASEANELDPDRAKNLRELGIGHVTENDATKFVPTGKFSVVVNNPPFGTIPNVNYNKFGITKLEHLIGLKAFEAMNDEGAGGTIIGANMMEGGPQHKGAQWIYENYLYSRYYVVGNFEVSGDLYAKQGASWPVRVLVIAGRRAVPLTGELSPKTVERLNTWDEVWKRTEEIRNEVIRQHEAMGPVGQTGLPVPAEGTKPTPARPGSVPVEPGGTSGGTRPAGRPGGGGTSKPTVTGPAAGGATGLPPARPPQQPQNRPPTAPPSGGRGGKTPSVEGGGGPATNEQPDVQGPSAKGGGGAKPGDVSKPVAVTTAFQVPYVVHSDATPFGTLSPTNIAVGQEEALVKLEQRVGNLDEYVANRLNMEVEELRAVLAAEQVDGVALAIDQVESGGAMIIGDETGIGKGRQAAALIRYAILNGKIPMFFTYDPKLFSDMYADLKAIHTEITPLIFGDTAKATIVDTKGNVIHRAPGSQAQKNIIRRITANGWGDSGFNVIFSTYSQINERNLRQTFLEGLAAGNPTIAILDEAHAAAGDATTSMQAAFMSGGMVQRGKGSERTTIPVPGLLRAVGTTLAGQGGVLYLSATYAKRPENMPVYFRTALSTAAQNFDQIVTAMKRGGVAIQQAVSEGLAKSGQYVRRERDFSGVDFKTEVVKDIDTAVLLERVDGVTDVLQEIIDFSKRVIDAIEAGATGQSGTAMSQNQTDMTDFAAVVHNQIGQLLLAAKAEEVIKKAVAAKASGEKPVIALMNTMETFLTDYARDNNIKPGQKMTLRWNELLKYALHRTLRQKETLPNGDTQITYADPEALGLKEAYDSIVELANELETPYPVSPIDYILQGLNKAGVTMYELTGRESGIDYTDMQKGEGIYKVFRKANKNQVVNGFNAGKVDGMLLNASGAVGLSAHASVTFEDQKPRHMIIAQAALDVAVLIQTLGRIRRTGMVLLGTNEKGEKYGARYTYLTLPLQAELRPAAMTNKKLKSLNANTTSDSEGAVALESEDILNRYGDRVVTEFLEENPELQWRLNLPIDENQDGSPRIEADIARKFTGRMAVRPDAEQKTAYTTILAEYKALIQQLKANGEYDLEIVVHDGWDGRMLDDQELAPGTDESNIFTASLRMQRWQIKDERHVPTGAEMVAEFQRNLESREKVQDSFDSYIEQAGRSLNAKKAKLEADQAAVPDDELAALRRASIQVQIDRVDRQLHRMDETRDTVNSIISDAGDVVRLTNDETGDSYDGMLADFKMPAISTTNPRVAKSAFRFRFMVNTPGGAMYANASQFTADKWSKDTTSTEPSDLTGRRGDSRVERWFIVGNPIRGYGATNGRGRMVRFVSEDGKLITGIMMPNNWGPQNLVNDPRLDLINGKSAAHFLTRYSNPDWSTFTKIEAGSVVGIVKKRGSSDTFTIATSRARSTGGKIYLDQQVRDITGDFVTRGQRMEVDVRSSDLEKVIDRISAIVGQRFRPVGDVAQLVQNVQRANNFGRGGPAEAAESAEAPPVTQPTEAPQEPVRPPEFAQGIEGIRALLSDPNNGMTEEARRNALAFLDTPAVRNLDWSGLVVRLYSRAENERRGGFADVANDIMAITREARGQTVPHEFFHFLYELLPSNYRQSLDDARHEAIDAALAKPGLQPEERDFLETLKTRTMTSREFQIVWKLFGDKYGDDALKVFREEYYKMINPGEFLAEFGGNKFRDDQWSKRNQTRFQKLWDKVKEFFRSLFDALKRTVGMSPDVEQVYRELLAGRYQRRVDPELQALLDAEGEVAESPEVPTPEEREATIEEGVREKYVPTKVLGQNDFVRGREQITPQSTQEALVHARNIFNEAGLTVVADMSLGGWRVVDRGYDQSAEGRRLAELLKHEIQTKNEPGKAGDLLASLLNSVVLNFKAGTINFDMPTRLALYELAQSDRSQRGLALGALAGFRDDLQFVGRNVDVVLHRIYSDAFGGDQVGGLMERVIRNFRSFFTDAEIENALKSKENAEELINKIIALNRRDEGGRVYRKVQALLKPKQEKKLAALEADARVEEAVNEILQQAAKQGIEPTKSPTEPLPALRKLLLMVSEKNAAKIDRLIAAAVAQAERNAGIAATLKSSADEEERASFQAFFAEGGSPSAEMIDEGLTYPEYSHWRDIRDNLLEYSPTTVKLVQDVVREQFKGTVRNRTMRRVADTRIDLAKLAVAPEDEVRRVLDATLEQVEANMDLEKAPPETIQRVQEMIEQEVLTQLEAVRKKYRDPMFTEPKSGAAIPAAEHARRQINAGLFRDPRLVREMVQRVAAKSTLQRLTPKLPDLIKKVFETPFYRQEDLQNEFARRLVTDLGVSTEQAEKAAEVFAQAFAQKFAEAKTRAFKIAREAITPKEPALIAMKKSVWKRIEQAVNSGVFDTGTVLREIAREHGWTPPTDDQVAQMKEWSEEEQRLRELTPAEAARYSTPEKAEAARREKEAAMMERRVALKKKMEVEWAKMTRPISVESFDKWWANRRNFAAAGNELVSANLLLKLGFAPRQVISVLTQGAIHTPTRAMAHAIEQWQSDRAKGRDTDLWGGVGQALKDSYKARFAALQSSLYSTRAAFMGRGESRNVDRLMSGIAAVERISRQADIYEERGEKGKAAALRLFSLIRLGYRVAQALDNIHGLPAEYQEMILQVERGLREMGKTRAEIEMTKDEVIGDMHAEWVKAIDQARMWYDSNGQTPKKGELEESAWNIVKRWQYDRIRELGLPADDFEEQNRMLRSTIGWNERETKGLGGVVGRAVSFAGQAGEHIGLPLAIGRFGNAIATSINRQLAFTPFAFLGTIGQGESGWTRTSTDRTQRKLESALGSTVGAALLALAWLGVLVVRNRWPKDPEERDMWEAQGIKPGTVELHLGNGEFIPFSLNTGPFAPVAPFLAAGGALHDLMQERAKKQAKLDADAAKTGLPAGKIKPTSIGDLMAVAGAAAQTSIMGGRTAAGLMASITDYGLPNSSKMLASQVAPLIPGLPAMQEISRMAGVNLDSRMAGFWDFMLPLPTSSAVKVNLLGEPAGTPNDLQRIIQTLTGGTYPGVVDPKEAQVKTAYEALFASGYRPPSIDPNKGYAIGGDFRPMTSEELGNYTVLRGRYFAEELAAVGATEDPKAARAAYQRANARALTDIGVAGVQTPSGASAVAVTARPEQSAVGVPNATAVRTTRGPGFRSTRSRTVRGGRARVRTTFARGPSLRVGRGLRLPRGKTVRVRQTSIRKRR